jgi:LmbE family N-acetylglucosaminyl deacetylase
MVQSVAHGMGVTDRSTSVRDTSADEGDVSALFAAVFGAHLPHGRAPRVLGVFAHPDDEVFCVGGTIARCAEAGAVTALASLTEGEAGQIRDVSSGSRRTLGRVRVKELEASAAALGVDQVTCLDLGDGRLMDTPIGELAAAVRELIDGFSPDTVVTFGPDGGTGHPDHVASYMATQLAVRTLPAPPRLLHARFPVRGQLMVDMIVEWLVAQPRRTRASVAAVHALRLFADGTATLGVAADHVRVEWYPPGSYIIEQNEPATELFCILSGSADVIVESDDGRTRKVDSVEVGGFVGEDGLFSGRPRNAHVIARDSVTCLVLASRRPSASAGRGEGAVVSGPAIADDPRPGDRDSQPRITVDVSRTLDRKVAALTAHRSQYALEPDLLARSMLERLLGEEHFDVAAV